MGYGILMEDAKRIIVGDWMYYIQEMYNDPKQNGRNYGTRRKDEISVWGIFHIRLSKGPDGKPDRTGASGYSVSSSDLGGSPDKLNLSLETIGAKSYLKMERGWDGKIILYLIKDGGQQ